MSPPSGPIGSHLPERETFLVIPSSIISFVLLISFSSLSLLFSIMGFGVSVCFSISVKL